MDAAGGSAQGGSAGSGPDSGFHSGAAAGGQAGSQFASVTSTHLQQQQPTSTSTSSAQGQTATSLPSTAAGSNPPGPNSGIIVGGVIGGVGALVLIALLVWYFVSRRTDERHRHAAFATYADLIASEAGASSPAASRGGVEMRGGEAHNYSEGSRLYFLPTYAESQAGMQHGARAREMLNTSYAGYESESTLHSAISPVIPVTADSPHFADSSVPSQHNSASLAFSPDPVSPQTPGRIGSLIPPPLFVRPQHTTDVVSSPIENPEFTYLRSTTPASIIAPIPRQPKVHQNSRERLVRDERMNATPEMQDIYLRGPSRTVSSRFSRNDTESPLLGLNPVRLQRATFPRSDMGIGVQRFDSQSSRRTSVISLISDAELERLGVGAQPRWI